MLQTDDWILNIASTRSHVSPLEIKSYNFNSFSCHWILIGVFHFFSKNKIKKNPHKQKINKQRKRNTSISFLLVFFFSEYRHFYYFYFCFHNHHHRVDLCIKLLRSRVRAEFTFQFTRFGSKRIQILNPRFIFDEHGGGSS